MKHIVNSILFYSFLLLFPVVLHAKIYPIQNYLSFKGGYTGLWVNPLKLKGPQINPPTGIESSPFRSNGMLGFSLGSYYPTKYVSVRGEAEYVGRLRTTFPIKNISASSREETIHVEYTIHSALFNLFLDINTSTFFVPYIGVGLGAAIVEGKHSSSSYSTDKVNVDFSFMAALGAAFYINKAFAIDIQARYSSFGRQKQGSQIRLLSSLEAAEAFIGIRYTL